MQARTPTISKLKKDLNVAEDVALRRLLLSIDCTLSARHYLRDLDTEDEVTLIAEKKNVHGHVSAQSNNTKIRLAASFYNM